ncbi:MAG: DUF554 domain-containing protein [Chloroflexi bacterium]|nr:DUF554 domain-containing protein [Chloroflexota bacterium]
MIGTLINVAAIIIGGLLGILLGSRLQERVRSTVMAGVGLFTLAYALQQFFGTTNALVVLGALIAGALLGEWWQIENGLARLGRWLEIRLGVQNDEPLELQNGQKSRFVRGFLTASLLFCIGPMAILGSIQDGLTGDSSTLIIKAVLDGFASLAFASTLGVGVLFSSLIILVYQGAISLLAVQVQSFFTPIMMSEMSATGGVILMAVAINSLLEIKQIRAGNFLPALIIAPILAMIFLQ